MARVGPQRHKKKKLGFSTNRLMPPPPNIAMTEISTLRQIRNEMTHLTGSQAVFFIVNNLVGITFIIPDTLCCSCV
jgi:hypothetical protein